VHLLDEHLVDETLPAGHGGDLCPVGVDLLPVQLTAAVVDVNLRGAQPALALPDETADPEDDDNGQR
jgi:hypothetical protein